MQGSSFCSQQTPSETSTEQSNFYYTWKLIPFVACPRAFICLSVPNGFMKISKRGGGAHFRGFLKRIIFSFRFRHLFSELGSVCLSACLSFRLSDCLSVLFPRVWCISAHWPFKNVGHWKLLLEFKVKSPLRDLITSEVLQRFATKCFKGQHFGWPLARYWSDCEFFGVLHPLVFVASFGEQVVHTATLFVCDVKRCSNIEAAKTGQQGP